MSACRPWIWILGLLPLALVAYAALSFKPEPIEDDLSSRAEAALYAAGHDWTDIAVDGRDVTLGGTAPNEIAQDEVVPIVARVWGVRAVRDETRLPQVVSPFVWRIERSAERIALAGHVPNSVLRADIVAAATGQFDGYEIADEMIISRGAPDLGDWEAATRAALDILELLASGRITLEDLELSIDGVAASLEAHERLQALSGEEIDGLPDIGTVLVLPPRLEVYVWSASHLGETIVLQGIVSSEQLRADVLRLARAAFPDHDLIDEMALADSDRAPDDPVAVAAFALAQLTGLEDGTVSIEDDRFSIQGRAVSVDTYRTLVAVLRQLPPGLSRGTVDILPALVDPLTWSASLDRGQVVLSGHIYDEAMRTAVLESVGRAKPDATVDDRMAIAAGDLTTETWRQALVFAAAQLAHLQSGRLALRDTALDAEGVAASPDAFNAIKAAFAAIPPPLTLSRDAVRPAAIDGYFWRADRDQTTLTLSGFVPDAAMGAAVLTAAGGRFSALTLIDQSQVAAPDSDSVDDGWRQAIDAALTELERLAEGSVTVMPGTIVVDGRARSVADHDVLMAPGDRAPTGFTIDVENVRAALIDAFRWVSEKDESGTITIETVAPSPASRDRFLEVFESLSGRAPMATTVIAEAPDGETLLEEVTRFSATMLSWLTNGRIEVAEGVMSIIGMASNVDTYHAAVAEAVNLPAGLEPGAIEIEPAPIGVLSWAGLIDDNAVTLEGFVPSEAVRNEIVDVAEEIAGDRPVQDRMSLAQGGAEAAIWSGAARFALRQLGRLSIGRVSLNGTDFSIEGIASSPESLAAIEAAVPAGIPGGVRLALADLAPPIADPYVWSATKTRADLRLAGHIPDEDARAPIVERVTSRFPDLSIVDEMTLASGAPRNMMAAVSVALRQLDRLVTGVVSLSGTEVVAEGEVWTEQARDQIVVNMTSGLPPSFTGVARVSVAAPDDRVSVDACQELIDGVLSRNTILFETGEARILEASFGLLDQLAYVAGRCPNARIEIAGHTDSVGEEDENQRLSEARARAIVDYLVAAGVARDRLTATGYGETRPIASNDTEEGRALNRRIEFNVEE